MRNHVNDGRVRQFISLLNTADANQILDLVQSLCPDIPIGSDGTENELAASPRPNNLYQVFVETGEELTFPNLTWQREGNVFSPSTLGSDLYGDELSAKIVNNGNISSLLWDCRWIVGNVKEKVDDVREEAKKITTMPIDYTKFTKPGKLGLLTIKDFNDGNHK